MFLTILAQTSSTPASTGTPAPANGNPASLLILFAVLGGFFYFFMLRPQRARQRRAAELLQALKVGDEVQTAAGMFGTIVQLSDEFAWVELAPGMTIKMLRRAVIGKVGPVEEAEEPEQGTAE